MQKVVSHQTHNEASDLYSVDNVIGNDDENGSNGENDTPKTDVAPTTTSGWIGTGLYSGCVKYRAPFTVLITLMKIMIMTSLVALD